MNNDLSFGRTFYRLYDQDYSRGCIEIKSAQEAEAWNKEQWGIFWTVNSFNGPRKNENLKKIISWSVDIDEGTKESQKEKIKKFPQPSLVIETKRGYQVYYNAEDATVENYGIIQSRLVEVFGGDPKAKDIARVLRVPGYLHWKDPKNPFAIRLSFFSEKTYSEKTMLDFFKVKKEKPGLKEKVKKELSFIKNNDLFERIYSMDCEQALLRLSGHPVVGCEVFTFKRVSSGNLNILVNGKSTSCFIDKDKRIGSFDKGGPVIWSWINWYHKDHKKTYQFMREYFPELFEDSRG